MIGTQEEKNQIKKTHDVKKISQLGLCMYENPVGFCMYIQRHFGGFPNPRVFFLNKKDGAFARPFYFFFLFSLMYS